MDGVGTAVGIASFGIQPCQGLLAVYDGWTGCHQDVSNAYGTSADLARTFTILKASLADSTCSTESRARVESCLQSCTEGLHRLQRRLSKLKNYSEPHGIRQKTWSELQRAWYPFRASTIAKIKENLDELRENLSPALQKLQQVTLGQAFRRTATGISEILNSQQAAKWKGVLDWLSPPDAYHNHEAACKKHEPGTGSWLIHSDEYKDWKVSKNVLWLTGSAGCGKTVLCSTVVEDIRVTSQADKAFAYFYFSFSDLQKQSYNAFLKSILIQLSRGQAMRDSLERLHERIYPSNPSTEALEGMILTCMRQNDPTVLVVDALDELPEGDEDGRPAILEWLERIIQSGCPLRVFLTSRQLPDIDAAITKGPLNANRVLLHSGRANNDIRKYVATELERHPKLRQMQDATKQQIRDVFERRADGMFRWAVCQLELLKNLKSTKPKYFTEALHHLPRTLDATYERMLLQIDDLYYEEALIALRWLAFEPQPLTLGQLAEACLINYQGEELFDTNNRGQVNEILEILAGLVVVEDPPEDELGTIVNALGGLEQERRNLSNPASPDAGRQIRLAHFSVKEYLISPRIAQGRAAKYALSEAADTQILAQSCLAYLLYYSDSPLKTSSKADLTAFPFLAYAAESWPTLLSKSQQLPPAHEMRLLRSEKCRKDWTKVHQPEDPSWPPFKRRRIPSVGTALYYASLLDLAPTARALLDGGADIDTHRGVFDNALQAASVRGHVGMVKLLLERGADANLQGTFFDTALQAASDRGYSEVVSLLLAHGAEVNAKGARLGTAIYRAAAGGCTGPVKMFLDRGLNVRVLGQGPDEGVVEAPAYGGHSEVVRLLLDAGAGAEIYAQGNRFADVLQAALDGGDRGIVELLLENGAASKAGGDVYGDVLRAAIRQGQEEVVMLLLEMGAEFDAQGSTYDDALQSAAYKGHRQTLRLLLDKGADTNSRHGEFGSALHAAAHGSDVYVVEQLLSLGADVTKRDHHGWTPSMVALTYGHAQIAELLPLEQEAGTLQQPVPATLVSAVRFSGAVMSPDGLRAGAGLATKAELDAGLQCRANHPFPFASDTFYFEVTVLGGRRGSLVGIGVCEHHSERNGMPGWHDGSWGYHGDDGKFFHEEGFRGKEYGPTYGKGDTVGCGKDKGYRSLFFTKNGQHLGDAASRISGRLFAVVGIGSHDVEVSINFGQHPFLYESRNHAC